MSRTARAGLGRRLTAGLLVVAASALAATVHSGRAAARPEKPAPSVRSVTAKLDQLAQRAEVLTEQFNAARHTIAVQQQAIRTAQHDSAVAAASYGAAREKFVALIVSQYENEQFGSVGAVLASDSPEEYLASMSTEEVASLHAADIVRGLRSAQADAATTQVRAHRLIAAARAEQAALDGKRKQINAQIADFHALLDALNAAQRAAYIGRGAPTPGEVRAALTEPAPSAAAERAVRYAVAQVGKPYVWAAAGPDAFDCSGLTMAAWKRGGVSLPHFSAAQYAMGRHVGYDQLEPGDLVFLYSDIHHVEMYIGGGIAVSAPQEGEPVQFVWLANFRSDFYGGARFG